jgi:hypothetical protein
MMQAGSAERLVASARHPGRVSPGHAALELSMTTPKNIWIGGRRAVEVPCSIEIEQTRDTLHAHVSLDGIEVDCGDEVLIHDAPSHVGFGERIVTTSRATVVRATPLARTMTRLMSYLQLTELYEVGFQPIEEVKSSFTNREYKP